MDTTTQSEIFFLISSISFVILWILVAIFVFYLIQVTKTFSRIINKLEEDIETISDNTKDIFMDIRESTIVKFLLGGRRKSRKNTKTLE